MKKIVINMSDSSYEKLKIEAMTEDKSLSQVMQERIFYKGFSDQTLREFDNWLTHKILNLIRE